GLRGHRLECRAQDHRMPVPRLALRSAPSRRGDRRTDAAAARRPAVENRRGQARGGEAVHRPRRHHPELKFSRRSRRGHLKGRVVMLGKIKISCAAAIVAAVIAPAAAQEVVFPASLDPVPGPTPAILERYAPVTAARLKKPEDANWLLFRRTYDGWGYSPLAAITPANVARLAPVWSLSTGQVEG